MIHLDYAGQEIGHEARRAASDQRLFDVRSADRSAAEAGPELFDRSVPAAFVSSHFVLHFQEEDRRLDRARDPTRAAHLEDRQE